MNGYTFAAIVFVTLGAVAIAWSWHFRKAWHHTVQETGKALAKPVDAAANVANNAIDAARSTAAPVADGVGDICHSIARRIETKRDELKNLREQVAELTTENEQLKSRRISVDQIQPILKIAFLQADFSETNFIKKSLRTTPGTGTARNEEIEYLGVYRATNTQRFGVDLNRIKFRMTAPATIEVAGFDTTEVIGNLNTQITPVHTELRRHLTGGLLAGSHEIVDGDIDKLLLTQDRIQRDELHKAITQNQAVQQIDRTLEQVALQFLKDYFAPRGYTLVKAVGDIPDATSLYQISAELNARLDEEVRQKTSRLADIIKQRDQVDTLLAQDIEELKGIQPAPAGSRQRDLEPA